MLSVKPVVRRRSARGVSLIEVSVATGVLLCVVAGHLGLLLSISQRTAQAEHHLVAAGLASEIVQRMRLNRGAALAGDYEVAAPGTRAAAAGRAQEDLREWHELLARRLPRGAGYVTTRTAGGVVTVTVVVQWAGTEAGPAGSGSQQPFRFRL